MERKGARLTRRDSKVWITSLRYRRIWSGVCSRGVPLDFDRRRDQHRWIRAGVPARRTTTPAIQQIRWNEQFDTKEKYNFDAKTKTLIARSAHYLSGDAHCCISAMDIFTCNGKAALLCRLQSTPSSRTTVRRKEKRSLGESQASYWPGSKYVSANSGLASTALRQQMRASSSWPIDLRTWPKFRRASANCGCCASACS